MESISPLSVITEISTTLRNIQNAWIQAITIATRDTFNKHELLGPQIGEEQYLGVGHDQHVIDPPASRATIAKVLDRGIAATAMVEWG